MSKTKSGLSETPKATPATPKAGTPTSRGALSTPKVTPATPKVSRLSRGGAKTEPDSTSPLQNSRNAVDQSPRSVNSKPTVDRRSPRVTTPAEKPQTRLGKGSELQAQLTIVQEDLKTAKEQITLIEKEKAQALDELKQAQKNAEEANEKLQEALVAQKRAEENFEIEKFRAVELEQVGIEEAQKKEEEWQNELENVRNQHAVDVATLLATTHELQKAKQEMAELVDAKNQALSNADDVAKIAEIHSEKVEILSAEVMRLKTLLDAKLETEANESNMMIMKLEEEVASLKQELEKVKDLEDKLIEKEANVEKLSVEIEAAKMAESYARNLVEEWKTKVDDLEKQAEEANKLEKSASESLDSVMKQLEDSKDSFHDAQAEIAALKEKVVLLEMTIGQQKTDLEESGCCLNVAKEENIELEKKVESLKLELETSKEERALALNNEKIAVSDVQSLLEEKNKLINELDDCKIEEEKSKKAMESLTSALHEASTEAREAKEKLLSNQVERENCETQIEGLRLALKESNEKYETLLDEAKQEINLLKSSLEESKNEYHCSESEWEQKEQHLVNCVKKSEEENIVLKKEIDRLVNLVKRTEEEVSVMREKEIQWKDSVKEAEAEVISLQETLGQAREKEVQLKDSVKEAEAEVISLQETLGQARVESMKMKESLLDKENELQSIIQENEELQIREAISLKKIEELLKLLEEAEARKDNGHNGELTDSEKDYDLLPKVVEFSEENGHIGEDNHKEEHPLQSKEATYNNSQEKHNGLNNEAVKIDASVIENTNEDLKQNKNKEKEDDSLEVEFKMWESCKIEKREFSPGRDVEQKPREKEVDSKVEAAENVDQVNGISSTETADDSSTSPTVTKENPHKKKKPLLRKFGSLLKKRGSPNLKQ